MSQTQPVLSVIVRLPGEVLPDRASIEIDRRLHALVEQAGARLEVLVLPSDMLTVAGSGGVVQPLPEQAAGPSSDEITVKQAAEILGISNQAVLQAIGRNRMSARRLGPRMFLIKRDSVLAYRTRCETRRKKK